MLGELCAMGAALTWSVSVILFKRSEAVSPQGMNLFKNLVATALLAATLPLFGAGIDWQRSGDDWARLVLSGILGIAVADTLVFMALKRMGAALLAVVDCAYAPTIVLLSVAFLGEELGAGFFVGAALVVGGVLWAISERLVRTPGLAPAEGRHLVADRAPGVVLGVLGIVSMAVGVVIAKPVLERSQLVEVTLVRMVAGVVGQLSWIALVPGQRTALAVLRPSSTHRTLVPASVLGSYIAMLLWLGGFKWAPASVAAVLNQLSSVFTIVLARIVLGEAVTPRRALGAAGAVAGALAIVWSAR